MRGTFARERLREPLEYTYFTHRTPMLRRLRNVDMWMQHNKVTNLRLAVKKLNGIVIHPGETFSYWYLIGMPTRLKGYKKGMILRNGHFEAGYRGRDVPAFESHLLDGDTHAAHRYRAAPSQL